MQRSIVLLLLGTATAGAAQSVRVIDGDTPLEAEPCG
jgi:hypothetical protein